MRTSAERTLAIPPWLALVTFATFAGAEARQSGDPLALEAQRILGLAHAEVLRLDVFDEPGSPLVLELEVGGLPYLLDLAPHSLRSERFELLVQQDDGRLLPADPGAVRTLRGELLGAEGSLVAGAVLDDGLYARIRLAGGSEYWIQPLARQLPWAPVDAHVLYSQDDVQDCGGACGSELLPNNPPAPVAPSPGGSAQGGALQIAELGCDSDYEYFLDWGSVTNVSNRIQSVIATMNLQYEAEVGISHEITTIIVRSTSNDPYTSSDAVTLLNQFRNHWNSSQGGVQRDVAHLFTGRALNGSTIGIAWLGVVCFLSYGYGLVESDFSGNFSCVTDLSAHELGHNWNADHCSCTSNTMNSFITCANTFHPSLTRPEIVAYRDSVGCLETGGGGGPEILFSDGFESGNFSAGGWTLQNSKPIIHTGAARFGTYGARIRHTSWIDRAVDTSGYDTINLLYSRRTRNFDSGERLTVEYTDGFLWYTLENTTGTNWLDRAWQLNSAAENNPFFRIRFRTNGNQNTERGDVDEVIVVGTPN